MSVHPTLAWRRMIDLVEALGLRRNCVELVGVQGLRRRRRTNKAVGVGFERRIRVKESRSQVDESGEAKKKKESNQNHKDSR